MDFRPLFGALCSWRSKRAAPSLYYEFLLPWLDTGAEHIDWLKSFSERRGLPIPSASVDDLWDLYSISRVNELLLTAFQEPPVGPFTDLEKALWVSDARYYTGKMETWNLTLEQYVDFMTAMGFAVQSEPRFTPVLHEIVEVEQSDDPEQSVQLVGEFWPSLMLGSMVFSRAGVLVQGGTNHVVKAVAEGSATFWAWLRRNRRAQDLSKGWGSNSQWRTDFRRDYIIGDHAHLNVDARKRYGDRDDLNEAHRRELLLHRCFITPAPGPAENLWPYDQTTVVPFP